MGMISVLVQKDLAMVLRNGSTEVNPLVGSHILPGVDISKLVLKPRHYDFYTVLSPIDDAGFVRLPISEVSGD